MVRQLSRLKLQHRCFRLCCLPVFYNQSPLLPMFHHHHHHHHHSLAFFYNKFIRIQQVVRRGDLKKPPGL